MIAPWAFDAETHEPLGPASAQLADQAVIRQHMGDLWAYEQDGVWHHYSCVIQADSAFAVRARNVYVWLRNPEKVEPCPRAAPATRRFLVGSGFIGAVECGLCGHTRCGGGCACDCRREVR